MSDGEKKLIRALLIIIAITSCILIIKINITPKYDPKIYEEVYSEYEDIIEKEQDTETGDTNDFNTNDENVTYKVSGITSEKNIYTVDGKITIPKIKIVYPIVNETTDEYLKVAPTKFTGPHMHEVGNYCIAGHNYKNDQFFSKLSQLEINDEVYLTSKSGKKMKYLVYDKYEVNERDLSCTNQNTNGRIEVTLITCTNQKQNRLVIKCRIDS